MKNEMVTVVYKGIVHEIPKQTFDDLKNGWISWKDLFD